MTFSPRKPTNAKAAFGIDLGTTHTVAARWGKALPIAPNGPAPQLLPSMLAFPPSGQRLIGWPARARRAIDPRHTLLSTKRLIGARFGSQRAQHYGERYPVTLVEQDGRACMRTRAGIFDPIDVAAQFLGHAALAADLEPGELSPVVTVPSSFTRSEREATLEAARRAGFIGTRLIDEPVATAAAYLSRCNLRYAAIYDLGGGTFDFAIVDCSKPPFAVSAHGGDPYLGGDDVDRELSTCVAERTLRERRWDLSDDAETFARLVTLCESTTIELSKGAEQAELDLNLVDPAGPWGAQSTATISHAELSAITMGLVRRSFVIVDHVLAEARVRPADVDAIFLAGGSASLPGLAEAVQKYFNKRPRYDLDPSHVVAIGASQAAARPDLAAALVTHGDRATSPPLSGL